jgi:hypothetical protein
MILAGTFSSGIGFGAWLRQLVANVAVFPMVRIMLFLAHYFFWGMRVESETILTKWSTVNPLGILPSGGETTILPGYLPFDVGTGLLGWVLSFGIFFLTPKIGDIIKSMIEGKPFAYGTAIGEAFGPVSWGAGKVRDSGAARAYREEAGRRQAQKITSWIGERYGGPGAETIRDAAKGLIRRK